MHQLNATSSRRLSRLFLILVMTLAAPALFLAGARPVAHDHHTSTLKILSVDTLPDGEVVLTLDAAGDLRGLITLKLRQFGGGYTGEWAFTVAHADLRDPANDADGEVDHHDDAEHLEDESVPHKDFLRLVQRGALQGAVTAASISSDNGVLTDISATLTVVSGAKEFDGVTGSGQATLSTLKLELGRH
jgi:hypothetical protein